jgi:hypothetical protein
MGYVCSGCFEDEGLRAFVKANAESPKCSFCGANAVHPIAAKVRDVAAHFRECVEREYADAANHLPYENAEGGYQGEHWDSYDLITEALELELPRDHTGALFEILKGSLDDIVWCRAHPYSLNPFELADFSWKEFSRIVKHERRYSFAEYGRVDDEALSPTRLLNRIVEYAELQHLFVELTPEIPLYRARSQERTPLTEARDLGPPPPNKARQNRMSPAGISMLYVSDSPETALREIQATSGEYAVATFNVTKPVLILDLNGIPAIPSLFAEIPDSLEYEPRPILTFLHRVRREISRPVPRNDRVHIEYVPTQIVTEFIRFRPLHGGRSVYGIRYPCAVAKGSSLVLFATQRNVVGIPDESLFADSSEKWIEMQSVTTHSIGP